MHPRTIHTIIFVKNISSSTAPEKIRDSMILAIVFILHLFIMDIFFNKLDFMKNLHLHNVSFHRKFLKNRFINKCVRKKKAKIPFTESRSFFSEI